MLPPPFDLTNKRIYGAQASSPPSLEPIKKDAEIRSNSQINMRN